MKHLQAICIAAALLLSPVLATATHAQAFTAEQKEAIQDIVRELLIKKEPELVIKGAEAYQKAEDKKMAQKSKEALKTDAKKIFHDPDTPVAGNPKGDVTVVEFFDYACGYCKRVESDIQRLLKEDKDVRFVFKELPIFGPASEEVSKLALASQKQGKYFDFHIALLKSKKRLNKKRVLAIAKSIGLDTNKLQKDAADPKIAAAIADNKALAMKLGATGTPTFIIGETLYPGALSYAKIQAEIIKVRAAKRKNN